MGNRCECCADMQGVVVYGCAFTSMDGEEEQQIHTNGSDSQDRDQQEVCLWGEVLWKTHISICLCGLHDCSF